jgi:hypothetical protein
MKMGDGQPVKTMRSSRLFISFYHNRTLCCRNKCVAYGRASPPWYRAFSSKTLAVATRRESKATPAAGGLTFVVVGGLGNPTCSHGLGALTVGPA